MNHVEELCLEDRFDLDEIESLPAFNVPTFFTFTEAETSDSTLCTYAITVVNEIPYNGVLCYALSPFGLWTEAGHNALGRYGGKKFDYARLDRDHPATKSYEDRKMHFMKIGNTIHDALLAARNHSTKEFEYAVHEIQDYYAHTAAGYGPKFGHWSLTVDDPSLKKNKTRYIEAGEMTRLAESVWDKYNPPDTCYDKGK